MDAINNILHFAHDYSLTTPLLVAGVLLIALVLWHSDGRAIGTSRRSDLSNPPGIPLLGHALKFLQHQDDLFAMWNQPGADTTAGKLSLTLPGRRFIDISRPDYIEHVQKTEFKKYMKGPTFSDNVRDVLGQGIFAVDNAAWQTQRKATSRVFTGSNFRGIISQTLEHDLKTLVKVIGHHADQGDTFDLSNLFFRFTLSSFSHMTFGQPDVGALESGKPVPFAEAFDEAQTLLDHRFTNPFWRITEVLTGKAGKMRRAVKTMDDFSYGIIDAREKEGLGNITADQKKDDLDLLSLYMALRDENGQPLTRRQLRDAVLNLIIAGRDTTAQALSWTFFHLITRGESVLAPVRKELAEAGPVDWDTWRTLTQTNAVFMEGLRLHPSVPKNLWQSQCDDQIPDGPMIKKGDYVLWSDWIMARNENIWGKDAKEFKPSRWIDTEGQLVKESQWKAHMFNGGYRLCLGQDLAKFEAVAVLANLLREFDFAFADDYKPAMADGQDTPKYRASLTLPMDAPLMVRATRKQ